MIVDNFRPESHTLTISFLFLQSLAVRLAGRIAPALGTTVIMATNFASTTESVYPGLMETKGVQITERKPVPPSRFTSTVACLVNTVVWMFTRLSIVGHRTIVHWKSSFQVKVKLPSSIESPLTTAEQIVLGQAWMKIQ